MAKVALAADVWTEVATTTTETAFTNTGSGIIYLATEDTTALEGDAGVPLAPGATLVIASGNAVEGFAPNNGGGVVTVVEIGTPAA